MVGVLRFDLDQRFAQVGLPDDPSGELDGIAQERAVPGRLDAAEGRGVRVLGDEQRRALLVLAEAAHQIIIDGAVIGVDGHAHLALQGVLLLFAEQDGRLRDEVQVPRLFGQQLVSALRLRDHGVRQPPGFALGQRTHGGAQASVEALSGHFDRDLVVSDVDCHGFQAQFLDVVIIEPVQVAGLGLVGKDPMQVHANDTHQPGVRDLASREPVFRYERAALAAL